MNKSPQFLFALAAFALSALCVQAQTPKILVVDMAKLYDTHYRTEEQNAKLSTDEKAASDELQRLNTEGQTLVSQYTELLEQTKNPALNAEARTKAEGEVQKKGEAIQAKQNEIATFRNNVQRQMEMRIKNFRDLMLEDISKVATEIAKKKGATLLLDKSGPSLIGISNIVYADASYDITDEVAKEINKDRPAAPAAPATPPAAGTPARSAPAAQPNTATSPAKSGDVPMITVPGAPKK
jgi:outer membrane protein